MVFGELNNHHSNVPLKSRSFCIASPVILSERWDVGVADIWRTETCLSLIRPSNRTHFVSTVSRRPDYKQHGDNNRDHIHLARCDTELYCCTVYPVYRNYNICSKLQLYSLSSKHCRPPSHSDNSSMPGLRSWQLPFGTALPKPTSDPYEHNFWLASSENKRSIRVQALAQRAL